MPSAASFHGRRAASIENHALRVTVLAEGGHIAEVLHKRSGVSPLWVPPWRSIEPSTYDAVRHAEYGTAGDAKLLAGIMGHNLCLDIFGGPSPEEAAAGITPHGEGSIVPYEIETADTTLTMRATLPLAQLRFERRITLVEDGARIRETVENLTALDRPTAWTQHVTLGPPFLQRGKTQFRASATRSRVLERTFGTDDYLVPSADFDWPYAPRLDGGTDDLRVYSDRRASSAYTAHLMDTSRDTSFFLAFAPEYGLTFGYTWRRTDFPWMGIWEENHSRTSPPWNGETMTRGMEFGVSPMAESRREMVDRGRLFGVPGFRWLTARGIAEVEYSIVVRTDNGVPEQL
jgi:hypothetical protein